MLNTIKLDIGLCGINKENKIFLNVFFIGKIYLYICLDIKIYI